ncbi:uncharacterized protein NECHADRAFT_84397 [Fusarium vanettenii 77-13-4]|uniref:F-box domain-containing protein n=1 Tax=Fusarium vanettenii (strain ATCC MYA-4622 / CBS 123669 / FGSC 9596 / NRRL 45880 / 77-13-4) TaxID=660122 RepID=C7ZCZ9_FUSV7|nr:uncharacterized protein NECHADRAFT_84397 [Fusarium vanettenii 77-13-4]EEU38007.1 hypothetical protein NECHADRAFT_84397 [Fusarium vanettenii 77-13-4]
MIQSHAFGTTEMIQEQVALVPGSAIAFEAATSEHRNRDRLTTLPHEILLEIYRLLLTFADKSHFSLASKYLHQIFEKHLYESAGKSLGWLPMFLAARQGNILTLNKCKKFGAPVDIFWDSEDDFKARASPEIQHGISPLEEAITNHRGEAVEWLLVQGASPNNYKRYYSPLIGAHWMHENIIACLSIDQYRTHPDSPFMRELRRRAENASRILDLLRGAGAVPSRVEAAWYRPSYRRKVKIY